MAFPFKPFLVSWNVNRIALSYSGQTRATIFIMVVIFSILALQGRSLYQARNEQLEEARIATFNMTRALAQHANDTVRAADVALVGIVERLETEGVDAAAWSRTKELLRMTVARIPALNGLFVYDREGNWLATSLPVMPANANNSDRAYFRFHASSNSRDVHIGTPVQSRSTGRWIIPVSRRIDHPDGSFAGVALATVEMKYFQDFHSGFDIGRNGAILFLSDTGVLIMRRPFETTHIGSDVSTGPVFQTYLKKGRSGGAVLRSNIDGVERMYSFQHLIHYPLIVSSALATQDVLAPWQADLTITVAVVAALLSILGTIGFKHVRQIEHRERMQRELHQAKSSLEEMNCSLRRLSLQDSLTGLGNRRLFDSALVEEFSRAARSGASLALMMIDVDYFKRYNDHYGHPAGDECLRRLGSAVMESGIRPGDVAVRYGGEELAVLLPNTDVEGACAAAERLRLAVLAQQIEHLGNPIGVVSVSIGAAAILPQRQSAPEQATMLVPAADRALYAAKAAGRNQVVTNAGSTVFL